MADEQAGIPASEPSIEERLTAHFAADAGVAQPEVAAPDASASDEETAAEEQPEQPQAEDDSGYEDVDVDGETFRLPPKVKEAVLRHADYTRKTQELAEHRRAVQSQMQAIQIAQAFQQATAEDQKALALVESQIAQYKDVRWQELDAQTLVQAKMQLDGLKERANELRAGLGQKAQQMKQHSEQAMAQFRAQRAEALQRVIPGWSSQADAEATRAALEAGFAPAEVANNFDARMGVLAYKAAQFDKLQSGKQAAVNVAKKAPPVIKPGASQGQNAIAQRKYVDARARLKKSGSLEDAAALFLQRMK